METVGRLTSRARTRLFLVLVLVVITYLIKDVRGLRFQIVGTESEGTMSPMTILLPVNGILLGPFYGTVATFLGIMPHLIIEDGSLDLTMSQGIFGSYSILLPVAATFMAGLLSKGRWKEAAAFLGGLLGVWYVLPTAREVWMLPYLHIITLAAIILLRNRVRVMIGYFRWKMIIGLFLVSLASVLTDHLVGNIFAVADPLGVLRWDIPASAFYDVILLYAVERSVIAVAATLFLTAFMYLFLTVYAPRAIILPTEEISSLPFGIPIGSVILLTGPPGSGKSGFSRSISYEMLLRGKTVLYMNCRASQVDVRHKMEQLGIDVGPYELRGDFRFLDACAWSMEKTAGERLYGDRFERTLPGREILAGIRDARPSSFVIDSISAILIDEPPKDVLSFLQGMIIVLRREKITTFMIVEEGVHDERFMMGLRHLADGVLELRLAEEMGKPAHYMRVTQLHGLMHPIDWIKFEVTPSGTLLVKPMLPLEVNISEEEVSATLKDMEKGKFLKSILEQLEEKKE